MRKTISFKEFQAGLEKIPGTGDGGYTINSYSEPKTLLALVNEFSIVVDMEHGCVSYNPDELPTSMRFLDLMFDLQELDENQIYNVGEDRDYIGPTSLQKYAKYYGLQDDSGDYAIAYPSIIVEALLNLEPMAKAIYLRIRDRKYSYPVED